MFPAPEAVPLPRRSSRSRSRGGGDGDEMAKIQRLLDKRKELRLQRNYQEADRIREELRDMGVNVHDKDGTWTGPNGLSSSLAPAAAASRSFGGGGGDEMAKIQRLIDERENLRSQRNFKESDRIRDELRDMGVQVDDRDGTTTWTGPNGLRGSIGGNGSRKGGHNDRRTDLAAYPPLGASYPPLGAYGPPLPPGWEQAHDPASGRPYFCNRATGETSWTPPPMGAPGLPPGWEQVFDHYSGRPYFCNRATGQTSWVPPPY